MDKDKQQTVAMGSINYSKMTQDGDVADSSGISDRYFPYITTAKECSMVADGVMDCDCVSATLFDGKWVQVDKSGELYYGGKLVGVLTPGEKQFAAINTKLVIMPDKKYLDISGEEPVLKDMGADLVVKSPVFTDNSLSLSKYFKMTGGVKVYKFDDGAQIWFTAKETADELSAVKILIEKVPENNQLKLAFVYECFYGNVTFDSFGDDENGATVYIETSPPLSSDVYIKDLKSGKCGWFFISLDQSKNRYILNKGYDLLSTNKDLTRKLEIWSGNQTDMSVGTKKIKIGGRELFIEVVEQDKNTGVWFYYVDCSSYDGTKLAPGIHYVDKINNGGWSGDFANVFQLHSAVQLEFEGYIVSGKVHRVSQYELELSDLKDETGSALLDETQTLGRVVATISESGDSFLGLDIFAPGDVVIVTEHPGGTNEFSFRIDTIDPDGRTCYAASNVFAETSFNGAIKIERRIPHMDYICESDNRLYGCSIADNTIYASALGDPTNIYAYTGLTTGSDTFVVASEGSFTGCCPYDGGVMFWKSDKLHKLLGSNPLEYALYTYNIDGVQQGSHRSLQNINEVLYYKGDRGIFAFDGSPRLISENFGDKYFKNAVGGSDGERYYVSAVDTDGRSHFFSYNTRSGLWVREGDLKVSSFTRSGKDVYMLEGGEIKLYGAEETPKEQEWFIQFTPIYETIEGKKSYSRIKLRAEIPRGSYMAILMRCDGGRWAECGKIVGKREGIVPVMVPVNRCDKFELKISGKGPCTIHSILREYYVGGDR